VRLRCWRLSCSGSDRLAVSRGCSIGGPGALSKLPRTIQLDYVIFKMCVICGRSGCVISYVWSSAGVELETSMLTPHCPILAAARGTASVFCGRSGPQCAISYVWNMCILRRDVNRGPQYTVYRTRWLRAEGISGVLRPTTVSGADSVIGSVYCTYGRWMQLCVLFEIH
jgi:hypothetical protein